MSGHRLADVIAAIDAANARDPNMIEVGGRREPAELVYGRRMSETLARMAPAATEHARIAARGQHIERWTSPRKSYPQGRVGYLRWRKDLQNFHAKRGSATSWRPPAMALATSTASVRSFARSGSNTNFWPAR
jgi:hypothetical protein